MDQSFFRSIHSGSNLLLNLSHPAHVIIAVIFDSYPKYFLRGQPFESGSKSFHPEWIRNRSA